MTEQSATLALSKKPDTWSGFLQRSADLLNRLELLRELQAIHAGAVVEIGIVSGEATASRATNVGLFLIKVGV